MEQTTNSDAQTHNEQSSELSEALMQAKIEEFLGR